MKEGGRDSLANENAHFNRIHVVQFGRKELEIGPQALKIPGLGKIKIQTRNGMLMLE